MDRILGGLAVVGLGAIVFVAGSITASENVFPGAQIAQALQGGKALYSQLTQFQNVYQSDLWFPERFPDKGVTLNRDDATQNGVTLYTSGDAPAAYLMDMKGNVLHTWQRPFSTVWQAGVGTLKKPQPDSHVYFRHAHLYPNGDLLALYEGVGDTPYGYGMVKLDKNSNVIWSYPGRTHHQFDVGPDGRIYVLTHEFINDEVPMFEHLDRPRLEDFLVILSPDGQELKKIRLLTALGDSPYRHMIYTVSGFALADPLHANSVKYIHGDQAANFAFGDEGQILLSFRETNGLVVLDPDSGKITWGTRGPWIGQHDPDLLPSGDILLFDNYGNYDAPEGVSRVIAFDPKSMKIKWQYSGEPGRPLDSRIRSHQQRLENGNTLVTESNGGRIVEVAPDGTTVWEFVNPVRGGPQGNLIPIIAWAERLDPGQYDPALLKPESPGDRTTRQEADL